MSIQEKLQIKLKPHTDKIINNEAHDFDYFPAVLAYLIDEQAMLQKNVQKTSDELKGYLNKLDDTMQSINSSAKNNVDALKSLAEDAKAKSKNDADVLKLTIKFASESAKDDMNSLKLSLDKNSKFARNLLIANLITMLAVLGFVVLLYSSR